MESTYLRLAQLPRSWVSVSPSVYSGRAEQSDERSSQLQRVMSQENTEVARQLVASFADRGVDGVISFFDAAVEWTTATDEPDHQTYVGHSGIRRLYETWNELWAAGFEADVEPQDFIALNEHVVVPVKVQVRGRSSSVDVEIQETYVFTFVSGKIARVREFRTKAEALNAVEQQATPS